MGYIETINAVYDKPFDFSIKGIEEIYFFFNLKPIIPEIKALKKMDKHI